MDKSANTKVVCRVVFDAVDILYGNRSYEQAQDFDRKNRNSPLEKWAENHIGNCMQTSLTVTLFLEKLRSKGYRTGDFKIQKMEVEDPEHSGTHVWVESESETGIIAMDVAGNYIGDTTGHEDVLLEVASRILWG